MTPVLAFEEMRLEPELLFAMLTFLLPFARRKKHFLCRCTLSILAATLFSLLYFPIFHSKEHPDHVMLIVVWYTLLSAYAILFARFCFIISWCDAIFMSTSAFSCQNIVYVLVNEGLARRFYPELRNHLFLYILISFLFCFCVYSILYHVFGKHLAGCQNKLFDDTPQNILFYSFLFLLMLSALFHYQNVFENYPDFPDFSGWMMGGVFCIFLLTVQYSLFRMRALFLENARLEQFLHNSEKHYELSRESIEIINRKCHDLKHQLKLLSQVSEQDRQKYIQEAQKNIMFYQQLVHSDSEVINTILAEKGLLCEEHDIMFRCSVEHVELDFIKVADLYAILGNAIDNAIEYVEHFQDAQMRVINLNISSRNQFLNLQINNPYEGLDLAPDVLPQTTKGNRTEHGFGLKSIQYLVKQYGGAMAINTDNHLFTLQITIPYVLS